MARKVAGSSGTAGEKPAAPVQRLCNEIQLFDLCDLERCGHKQGLYCTSPELLNRFEAIAEEEERPAASGYISEEDEDGPGSEDEGYDDGFDDDPFGDEGYEEDE
jgi:hypothetical protein